MNQEIEKILNDVAKQNLWDAWTNVIDWVKNGETSEEELNAMISEAMHRLAEHCCKEQREQDVKNATALLHHDDTPFVATGHIYSAPLASDKYKP